MGKYPRASEKFQVEVKKKKFKYNEAHVRLMNEMSSKHLHKLRKENEKLLKRLRKQKLKVLEEQLIKKRLSDVVMKEDKLIHRPAKRLVNYKRLESTLNDLRTPKYLLHDENCNKFGHKHLSWMSVGYIIRHIRSCLLNHDWRHLTDLLIFLLNCNRYYLCYIKEMTFLNFLINDVDHDGELLEEFLQKCFTSISQSYTPGPFDITYEES